MGKVSKWQNIVTSSASQFFHELMNALPNILGALLLLLIGWLLARVAMYATRRVMQARALQQFTTRLNKFPLFQRQGVNLDSTAIISRFVHWVILLFFLVAASETLGWTAVSRTIGNLIGYLPALLSAIIILIIGLYIAQLVRSFIRTTLESLELGSARLLSGLAYYTIATIVVLTAMDQAGVDTGIITSNLILIIGSVMAAFAISFALASKDILQNILATFYSRQNFKVGDRIKIEALEGEIIKMDSVSVVIRTGNSEVVLPSYTLISQKIEKL